MIAAGLDGEPGPAENRRAIAVSAFVEALLDGQLPVTIADVERELRGKNLACWCRLDQNCHADVLLELANK